MGKLISVSGMIQYAQEGHMNGYTIVTTNGCFDVLHVGHKRFLESCKSRAGNYSKLLVLVNSDASVRRLKGEGRPCVPAHERAEMLSGFSCVDQVAIFDTDTPNEILRSIDPDIHCKGADYKIEDVPERTVVRRVELIPITPDRSSSSMIQAILCSNGHIDVEALRRCRDVEVDEDHDWGMELRLVNNQLYCGKFLVYDNNEHAGSCHYHKKKIETFKILSGEVLIYKEPDVNRVFKHGEEILIPREYCHQMRAVTERAIIMEVSTHHRDDDTYRVESVL